MFRYLVTILVLATAHAQSSGADHAEDEIRNCRILTREGLTMTPHKRSYTPGEEVSISCAEGYELMVANLTICLTTGQFIFQRLHYEDEHDEFSTENLCKPKIMCEYPVEQGVILKPRKSLYDVGEVVSVSCADGYEFNGQERRTCQIDEAPWLWIPGTAKFSPEIDDGVCEKIPTCRGPRDEPGLHIIERKDFYYEGDEIQFSCKEGFTLVGPESAVCTKVRSLTAITSGFSRLKFRPSLPRKICKRNSTCKPPRISKLKYSPKKLAYQPGESITLSCKDGYQFTMPNNVVHCREVSSFSSFRTGFKAMRFKIKHDACKEIPPCDKPAAQPGMVLLPRKEVYHLGDEVEVVCAEGYELTGPPTIVCTQVRSFTAILTRFRRTKFVPGIPERACRETEMQISQTQTEY